MSHSHRHRHRARHGRPAIAGRLLAGAAALVVGALVVVPWAAGRFTRSPLAPAVATFVALVPALYFWFRRVQRVRVRVAVGLALVYAALAGAVVWLWNAR